jgi:hypothetical protein
MKRITLLMGFLCVAGSNATAQSPSFSSFLVCSFENLMSRRGSNPAVVSSILFVESSGQIGMNFLAKRGGS